MKLDSVGSELGRREFDLSPGSKVTVIVGVPQRLPETEDEYFCAYQILGIGRSRISYAIGVDALQALELTLKKIGTDLYTSDEAKTGRLSWLGQSAGLLGFPVPEVLKDLVPE